MEWRLEEPIGEEAKENGGDPRWEQRNGDKMAPAQPQPELDGSLQCSCIWMPWKAHLWLCQLQRRSCQLMQICWGYWSFWERPGEATRTQSWTTFSGLDLHQSEIWCYWLMDCNFTTNSQQPWERSESQKKAAQLDLSFYHWLWRSLCQSIWGLEQVCN